MTHGWKAFLIAGSVFQAACGTVGGPVPPEYVGIGPRLEREAIAKANAEKARKQQEAERKFSADESRKDVPSELEGEVQLPELHPVGTR